ncbi:mCG1038099 [Mus musculus]|jgi:large subunit ribosomal protein L29e|nr:mCG1038099 [Mus musculus]
MGNHADMAKVKNHTSHNQFYKWHSSCIKKPQTQRYESPKRVDPKFLKNMHFAKHSKKDLKKMQASNAEEMRACAEAIKALMKPKAIKPKMPKGPNCKLSHLSSIAHLKLGKQIQSYMTMGCRLCQPKPKIQTKTEATAPTKV